MMLLERAVLVVAGLLAVLGVIGWVTGPSPENPVPEVVRVGVERGYFPCEHEDSVGPCYWYAAERGNGQGRSFLIDEYGTVHYN